MLRWIRRRLANTDSPAGTINMRTKRAFDRRGRTIAYNASLNFNAEEFTFKETAGPRDGVLHAPIGVEGDGPRVLDRACDMHDRLAGCATGSGFALDHDRCGPFEVSGSHVPCEKQQDRRERRVPQSFFRGHRS